MGATVTDFNTFTQAVKEAAVVFSTTVMDHIESLKSAQTPDGIHTLIANMQNQIADLRATAEKQNSRIGAAYGKIEQVKKTITGPETPPASQCTAFTGEAVLEATSTPKRTRTGFNRKTVAPSAFIEVVRARIPVGGHADMGVRELVLYANNHGITCNDMVAGKWVAYLMNNRRHGILVAKSRNPVDGTTRYRFSAV